MGFLARFFGSKRTESADSDDLRAKVRAIDDRLHDQERTVKNLQLEWEETYDKVTHLMARITKRRKALEIEEDRSSAAQDALGAMNVEGGGLTPSGFLGMHGRLAEARKRFNGR